jgi:hypothetical protein
LKLRINTQNKTEKVKDDNHGDVHNNNNSSSIIADSGSENENDDTETDNDSDSEDSNESDTETDSNNDSKNIKSPKTSTIKIKPNYKSNYYEIIREVIEIVRYYQFCFSAFSS